MKYNRVLTIAGSDSSAGAGIQADLKTISALKCYGATAITAITSQNTLGVINIEPVAVEMVESQIRAVVEDIGFDAVKIGMLYSLPVAKRVKNLILEYELKNIILDPVMVSTSGKPLLDEDAVQYIKEELFPIVDVITPNIPEIEVLTGQLWDDVNFFKEKVIAFGKEINTSVLVKGGHGKGEELVDYFYNSVLDELLVLKSLRISSRNTHGTGCTLSSAIAAYLAKGEELNVAISKAKEYMTRTIKNGSAYKLGNGHGSVHHFYEYW